MDQGNAAISFKNQAKMEKKKWANHKQTSPNHQGSNTPSMDRGVTKKLTIGIAMAFANGEANEI